MGAAKKAARSEIPKTKPYCEGVAPAVSFTDLDQGRSFQNRGCNPLNWITDNRISLLLLSEIAGPFIP
jgi:hypothetical protein